MYPDFSYVIYDLFGIGPDNAFSIVKTFGLMLVLAFIASAYTLRAELKRRYEEGLIGASTEEKWVNKPAEGKDYLIAALLGFILLFKGVYLLMNWQAFSEDPFSMLFTLEGSWGAGFVGAATNVAWTYFSDRKRKGEARKIKEKVLPQDRVWDITMVAAIWGIIGAKLFAIFESKETLSNFFSDPIGTLLSGSGLAIYGGLILAFIFVVRYVRKRNMSALQIMDAAAPALFVGYAVGRLGCHFSGDGDWGIVNTLATPSWWFLPEWMWSYDYPHNVLNRGELIPGCDWQYCYRLSEGVFPTPIYETIVSLLFAGILWMLRKRMQIAGTLFALYLILNGIERFWIEKIRVNDVLHIGGVEATQAEIISVLTFIAGIAFWIYRYQKSKK